MCSDLFWAISEALMVLQASSMTGLLVLQLKYICSNVTAD
jgi:hypothetical protein